MNDNRTHTYDGQTVRWLLPDPAEQFSNPYLAMGNNPVMYVDPDGEFVFLVVGAVVGAYIGGAMANDHLNPGKWDYSSGSTWAGMGVGAVVGAFGGHALAASKAGAVAAGGVAKGSGAAAKSATVFGKTMTKAAGKKYFGSTIGGLTNTISNYDGKDGFGWGTLGDFAAGFGGAYAGLSANSAAVGFNAGGFLNSTNNIAQDGFGSAVEFAQDWVGGGLSSMVGMKYGQFKGGFKPFNAEAKFGKFANKAVNSGFQANMWDFAYSDWEDYRKKGLDYHLTLFAGAGITAALTQTVMQPSSGFNSEYASGWQRVGESTGRGMWGYGSSLVEFNVASLIKSRQPYYSGGSQPNKAGVLGLKWFLNLTY